MNDYREVIEVEKTKYFMPYAPVVKVRQGGSLLFISGATALPLYHEHPHEHEKLNPPIDVKEQTRLVMQNIEKVLDASGAKFSDIVRTDIYVTDMQEQDAIGEVLGEYFNGEYPASTLLEVNRLVDERLKLEINAIAVIEEPNDPA